MRILLCNRVTFFAAILLTIISCKAKNESTRSSSSEKVAPSDDSTAEDLAVLRAEGFELADPDSDAKGLSLANVSLTSPLNFKGFQIAHCMSATINFPAPNKKEVSGYYCGFMKGNGSCRSVLDIAQSGELKTALNNLTNINAQFADSLKKLGYALSNKNIYTKTNSTGITHSYTPFLVDRITLESPCDPVVITSLNIVGPTLVAGREPLAYKAFVVFSDGHQEDITSKGVWKVSDSSLATFAEGKLTSIKAGVVDLKVEYQNLSAILKITMTDLVAPTATPTPTTACTQVILNQAIAAFVAKQYTLQNIPEMFQVCTSQLTNLFKS
jgi:hypothetical protein